MTKIVKKWQSQKILVEIFFVRNRFSMFWNVFYKENLEIENFSHYSFFHGLSRFSAKIAKKSLSQKILVVIFLVGIDSECFKTYFKTKPSKSGMRSRTKIRRLRLRGFGSGSGSEVSAPERKTFSNDTQGQKSYLWCNFYQFLDLFESQFEIYEFWKKFWNFEIFRKFEIEISKIIVRISTPCPEPEPAKFFWLRLRLRPKQAGSLAPAPAPHPCSKSKIFSHYNFFRGLGRFLAQIVKKWQSQKILVEKIFFVGFDSKCFKTYFKTKITKSKNFSDYNFFLGLSHVLAKIVKNGKVKKF